MSGAASAEPLRCPAERSTARLAGVALFDGPPSEHADLMPDGEARSKGGSTSRWDVAYVARSGRHIFVECQYGAGVPALILEGRDVKSCTYTATGGGRKAMACS